MTSGWERTLSRFRPLGRDLWLPILCFTGTLKHPGGVPLNEYSVCPKTCNDLLSPHCSLTCLCSLRFETPLKPGISAPMEDICRSSSSACFKTGVIPRACGMLERMLCRDVPEHPKYRKQWSLCPKQRVHGPLCSVLWKSRYLYAQGASGFGVSGFCSTVAARDT